MPKRSFSTFAIGARQFVVHDAFEMTVCASGSNDAVVDAHADHHVGVAARRGDHDPLRATLEVAGGLLPGGEQAGRLDDDVHAVRAPRDLGRVALLELLDLDAVDREPVVGLLDLVRQHPADGVVLQEERHGVRVPERVVHGDQLDARGLAPRASSARVKDRPMRPKPLMPTRTVMTPPCSGRWTAPLPCGRDYSRACRASASLGIVRQYVGSGDVGRHRFDHPSARIAASSAARIPPSAIEERVDPAPVLQHRPQVVGGVEAVGLRDLRPEVADLDDPAGRGGERVAARRGRRAPAAGSCRATPGRGSIWSAPAIASSASARGRRVVRDEPDPADPARPSSGPRPGPRPPRPRCRP